MIGRPSALIDADITVLEIEPGDEDNPGLKMMVELLNERGYGYFLNFESGLQAIVIDGRIRSKDWCTDDHLLAIEAHELGHYLVGIDEDAADMRGIELLMSHGLTDAAQLLEARLVHR